MIVTVRWLVAYAEIGLLPTSNYTSWTIHAMSTIKSSE